MKITRNVATYTVVTLLPLYFHLTGVIHSAYSSAEDVESYVQQTGRAGRDGNPPCAPLLYRKSGKYADERMVEYGTNTSTCRRDILFKDFDNYKHMHNGTLCMCCDVCFKRCNCLECNSKQLFFFLLEMYNIQ